MVKPVYVSVIVPTKKISSTIINELVPALANQSHSQFELIIVPDEMEEKYNFPSFVKICPQKSNPAAKRDYGVSESKGSVVAFIDDDAYPGNDRWLETIVEKITYEKVAAVCGPGLTPSSDNLRQHLSGYVWSSWAGAGGAGVYRNKPQNSREVDDYPTFNFAIKKQDFIKAGGFNTKYWPGEDTVLCNEIVHSLKRKIIYHPGIKVFHHRRQFLLPHIQQVARYGLHRGYFSKILPKTSRRLGYYAPLALLTYLLTLLVLLPALGALNLLIVPLYFYLALLTSASLGLLFQTHKIVAALLLPVSIFITHCVYGAMFIRGIFARNLEN